MVDRRADILKDSRLLLSYGWPFYEDFEIAKTFVVLQII